MLAALISWLTPVVEVSMAAEPKTSTVSACDWTFIVMSRLSAAPTFITRPDTLVEAKPESATTIS